MRSEKNWGGNEEQNFFIRSYMSEIKMYGVWAQVKSKKKTREGKCEVSRERHSDNRELWLWVDQVTIVCIGIMSWWTQGDRSWKVNKLFELQERKAKQGRRIEEWSKICKVWVAICIRSKYF